MSTKSRNDPWKVGTVKSWFVEKKSCGHCRREVALIVETVARENEIERVKTHLEDSTRKLFPKPLTRKKERVSKPPVSL